MLLDEFIKSTLTSILRGVAEARIDPETKNHGWVGPARNNAERENSGMVSFDVLVEASSSSTLEGKAGAGGSIKIFSGSAGVGAEKKEHSGQVSRVKFEVPIMYKYRHADSE